MSRKTLVFLLIVSFQIVMASCGSSADKAEAADPLSSPESKHESAHNPFSAQFSTDFSRSAIDFSEVIAGGPPKDGIPSIDNPRFTTVRQASQWLDKREPVLVLRRKKNGTGPEARPEETKIYPLQILMWHEIVNDRIAGDPVAVTYCPLCNTGLVFLSRVNDTGLVFGVSGLLRYSNMIMYDRGTESWWQQATGEAVAGTLTGEQLEIIPSLTISFDQARKAFPDAQVLSRDTGIIRPYGTNPYEGYDTLERPFLYQGPEIEEDHGFLDQVLVVQAGGSHRAVAYSQLQEEKLVQFILGGRHLVLFWAPGTASALDSRSIADGRDVGSANAFFAEREGEPLEFHFSGGVFTDKESGTIWNELGEALDGEYKGETLAPATAVQHFWFSWAAFSRELERLDFN
jgi:hypothetical protein